MAESVTEPPTTIVVADSVVVIDGLDLTTVRDSQDEFAGALFVSPEYAAWKATGLVELNVTDREVGTLLFVTDTNDTVDPVPLHVPLANNW